MARRPRIDFASALHHVIARGNRGQIVFRDEKDYSSYLRFLREYKEKLGLFLYAYALMPTHLHLLIETQETPLSQ
jgi:REP element-mobilizing transposase RayT